MSDQEKTELVVDEPPVLEKPGVTVDLTPKSDKPAPEKGESAEAYLKRLQTFESLLAASKRNTEFNRKEVAELRAQIENLSRQISIPKAPEKTASDSKDELDRMVEAGDWKGAVSKLAAEKAAQIIQERDTKLEIQRAAQTRDALFQDSKQKVYEQYPQLHPDTGNEEDPVSQIFIRVVSQHPEWHQNEYGPLLAMYETEKQARAQGVPLSSARQADASNKEVIRRGRATTGSLPPGRTGIMENKVTLTQSEKAFCDRSNIPYETFARNKQMLSQTGEVQA
jgi:hypothetical protein